MLTVEEIANILRAYYKDPSLYENEIIEEAKKWHDHYFTPMNPNDECELISSFLTYLDDYDIYERGVVKRLLKDFHKQTKIDKIAHNEKQAKFYEVINANPS
jgi:hypothetical protein